MNTACVAILPLILFFSVRLLSRHRNNNGSLRPPPSPTAVPFLGHLHLIKKPLHASLARLAAVHGPVFSLRLGSRNAVVVSSAACARECFTEHDVTFASRPQFPSLQLTSFRGATLAACVYGPYWRSLRRIATAQLLSAHRVSCMSGDISAEVRAVVRRLSVAAAAAPRGAAPVELKRTLFEASLSVLMETIAHTKASRTAVEADSVMPPEAHEFKRSLDEILPLLGAANMWNFLPVLRWFDVFGVRKKLVAAVNRRDAFLGRLIDAERRRSGKDEKQSMVGLLLSLQKTEPEVYTDKTTMALCVALKKAQAEMDACVGTSRLLCADDLPRLRYLHCVIAETTRLYPAVLMLLPHESSTDCRVGGFDVPSKTTLLINAYAIHRDPATWEDPAEFRPERFDGKAAGLFMIPFGMGRRKCPGETLALRMLGLVLGTLIQCFDWDRVVDAEVDMAEGPAMTLPKAVPLEALCRPRAAMLNVIQEL